METEHIGYGKGAEWASFTQLLEARKGFQRMNTFKGQEEGHQADKKGESADYCMHK